MATEPSETPAIRNRRWRRVVVAGLVLIAGAGIVLWLARVPIATGVIDRHFAAAGVTARYEIRDLGFGRQRLTNVVIGDPDAPDLVADWIETFTDIGSSGPRVTGVSAGRVRMRGRIAGGRLSIGSLDRLLPAPSGGAFTLPGIDVRVADGRMRLETPAGLVGLHLSGGGRLDRGFRGSLAAVAPRIGAGGCVGDRVTARLDVRTSRDGPHVTGPVRGRSVSCGDIRVTGAAIGLDLALGSALDRWRGTIRPEVARLALPGGALSSLAGRLGFEGDARGTRGTFDLTSGRAVATAAQAGGLNGNGVWRIAGTRVTVAGRTAATGAALSQGWRDTLAAAGSGLANTPAGPVAQGIIRGLSDAIRDADVAVDFAASIGGRSPLLLVSGGEVRSASGARVTLADDARIVIGHPDGPGVSGTLIAAGGGLPGARIALRQAAPGAPLSGVARLDRYAVSGGALEMTAVRFEEGSGGATRIATTATLSGPLGDGRIDRLTMPIDLRWDGGRGLTVNPSCARSSFDRLSIAGLVLDRAVLPICPVDGALLRLANGRMSGGARLGATRLAGRLGGSPLAVTATGARVRLDTFGLAVDGVEARLGEGDRVSRLAFAQIEGRGVSGVYGGSFTGGAGQIGAVPLLLEDAKGRWRFAGGALTADAELAVSDAAADARFRTLRARDVRLSLADGQVAVAGVLATPEADVKVSDVTIRHDLSRGAGAAHLAVPGITFGPQFQPDALTRLTFGVIADVKGTVRGEGDIAWSPDGVTSTGTFRTENADLAAAFGPVQGITGVIRFTDLLALESAPGQVATVREINPGVAVNDGRIVYRTLANNRVQVDSGVWPFAGGTLTLEPTLLDFSAPTTRKMTFRVDGMQAAQFLQKFDFKNLSATGKFDGTLPMLFDESGGRIENGRLRVREGGGTLAYVGELTEKDLGTWGNLAFQALKSLRYRDLDLEMNGPLAGEMLTEVHFEGVQQGEGAKSNFLIRRLQRLPFVFNIRIRAPFRGLIDSAASFYDPKRLIERNLPALIEQQNRGQPPVQPPASENRP